LFFIELTSSSFKELEKIVKKDRSVSKLMERKLTALQEIDLRRAIKTKQIKPVYGISGNILEFLAKKNYDPFIYEYRDFPKQYPYRIYFIKKDKTLTILRIFHHQNIKNKLAKQLANSIKENILKK
jgi:hypothetical protein